MECTFQIPGVCNFDTTTTVLCHLPDDSGTGKVAGKSADWIAAYGCNDCHDAIDRRTKVFLDNYSEEDRQWFMRRAMIRTWRILIESGVLQFAWK